MGMGSFAIKDASEINTALRQLGRNLKALRRAAGLSQKDLAVQVFLRPARVSQIERGQRAPRFHVLVSLARTLGVSVDDLTAGIGPTRREAAVKAATDAIGLYPGIRTAELATRLGVAVAYAHSVAHKLEADGEIISERGGWRISSAASTAGGSALVVPPAVVPELRAALEAELRLGGQEIAALNDGSRPVDEISTATVLARLRAVLRLLTALRSTEPARENELRVYSRADRDLVRELIQARVEAEEDLIRVGAIGPREKLADASGRIGTMTEFLRGARRR